MVVVAVAFVAVVYCSAVSVVQCSCHCSFSRGGSSSSSSRSSSSSGGSSSSSSNIADVVDMKVIVKLITLSLVKVVVIFVVIY